MSRNRFCLLVAVVYFSIMAFVVTIGLHNLHQCPLAKQGCDCGHICTRTFNCVDGMK